MNVCGAEALIWPYTSVSAWKQVGPNFLNLWFMWTAGLDARGGFLKVRSENAPSLAFSTWQRRKAFSRRPKAMWAFLWDFILYVYILFFCSSSPTLQSESNSPEWSWNFYFVRHVDDFNIPNWRDDQVLKWWRTKHVNVFMGS